MKKNAPAAIGNESTQNQCHSAVNDLFPEALPPDLLPTLPKPGTVKFKPSTAIINGKVTQAAFPAKFGFASPPLLYLLLITAAVVLVAVATGGHLFAPQQLLCLMLAGMGEASKVLPKKLRPPYRFSINLPNLIADTSHLAPEAFGCLMRLMMHYWRHGPLKDDNRLLARIVGLPPNQWASVRPDIEGQFEIVAGLWLHDGLDQALADAFAAIAANKDRTAKATAARMAKRAAEKKPAAKCDVERHVQRDDERDSILNGSKQEAPVSPAKEIQYSASGFAADALAAERQFVIGGGAA